MEIRPGIESDFDSIIEINHKAFGQEEEGLLVSDLLKDATAQPLVSLLAFDKEKAIGHILFTKVKLEDKPDPLMHILAPMSVLPEYQGKGIGGQLIRHGFDELKKIGSRAVLVLGHFDYYPKFGFQQDAKSQGLEAPYPIPDEYRNGWMVNFLAEDSQNLKGRVICADSLMKEKYWVE